MPAKLKSIAVLIDADNASARNIGHILQEIENIGHITCKKIYGDWGNAHIQSWQEALLKYAIDPMQHFAYVKGKNATDIGMVIEAMDLLYSNNYDGFCLISSDSDFTSLALRIRKNHVKVFGFGKRNTVSAFSQACDKFFYVEDLLSAHKKAESVINPPIYDSHKLTQNSSKTVSAWGEKRLKCDTKLLNSLRASIIDHPKAEDDHWVNFALVGSGIKKHYPSFDPKYYGYSKLADIIKNIDLFETKFINSTLYVRDKNYSKIGIQSNASTINKNMDNTKSYPVFMNSNIEVSLRSPSSSHIDYIAFRLTNENVVRGDQDMVFYGQNESPDASLILKDLQLAPSSRATYFSCKLAEQDKKITQIVFVATAQDSNLKSAHPIKVSIRNSKKIIYEGEFGTDLKSAQTRKLFVLVKKSNEWHMHPQNSVIKGDLRFLCEKYGIEISDD